MPLWFPMESPFPHCPSCCCALLLPPKLSLSAQTPGFVRSPGRLRGAAGADHAGGRCGGEVRGQPEVAWGPRMQTVFGASNPFSRIRQTAPLTFLFFHEGGFKGGGCQRRRAWHACIG